MSKKLNATLKQEALDRLHVLLPEGSTVYFQFVEFSESANGNALRTYGIYAVHPETGRIENIAGYLHQAFGWKRRESRTKGNGIQTVGRDARTIASDISYALYEKDVLECVAWI